MGPRALVSDQQVTGWSVVAQHEIAVWLTLGVSYSFAQWHSWLRNAETGG